MVNYYNKLNYLVDDIKEYIKKDDWGKYEIEIKK